VTGDATCDYCDGEKLVYELRSDRGQVARCIVCLAIEQGQQALGRPFDVFAERDEEGQRHSYEKAGSWFAILARINDDSPILKPEDEDYSVDELTREFVENIMGSDAYEKPSEVAGSEVDVAQQTIGGGGE
jgi:hypothetical protein